MDSDDPPISDVGDPDLRAAHADVTITAPRWVFDVLIGSAEVIADAEDASQDLRADCAAAARIGRARLPDDPREDTTDG